MRKGKRTSLVRWSVCLAAVGLGLAATSGAAQASSFGHYYLQVPYTSGPYNGTRASILTPNYSTDWTVANNCVGMRSDAEDDQDGYSMQTGYLYCAYGYTIDNNQNCTGDFTQYVEHIVSGVATCFAEGTAPLGANAKYSVADLGNNANWQAYIDGSAKGSSVHWPHDATTILEGGEFTSSPTCGVYSVAAEYGQTVQWQRYYAPSATWLTVGSAYSYLGTCWSLVGGPTGSWFVDH